MKLRPRLAATGARPATSGARVEDLLAQRDLLSEALAAVPDAVVVVDTDGRVVLRNEAAERFNAARHSDALAEDAVVELLARACRGQVGERELQLFGPPREVLWLRAVPLSCSGMLVGAVAFLRDVSEARRIESVRRDFVANVSHELKTPIGALGLLAETMAAEHDDAVMRQLAERVAREADRLGRIVEDLLDLSLIEAQELPIREQVPLGAVLTEAAERVRLGAETSGMRLQVAEPPPELVVCGDRRQLVAAVTNLLDNATKYSDPGSPVELGAAAVDDRVVISVRDRGIGIPSRDLERIFERFYRVDRARSRATGGTGLGLAIVRHVAQVHGGDVMVESREGEGSTFRLRLPTAGTVGGVSAVTEDAR